jgi:hypothetical protein
MRKASAKPKLSRLEYAARFAVQQRRYCDAFALWRTCQHKLCRRSRRCGDDGNACLGRALAFDRVPHQVQWRTRQDILLATPLNIGAPERAARQCMPLDFYESSRKPMRITRR